MTRLIRGAGRQRGEFFQELDGLEQEVTGSIGPLALQGEKHLSLRRESEAILRDRRSQDVAGEPFEC